MRSLCESEAFCHSLQIKRVDIEHFLYAVSGVGMEIGLECIYGLPIQIVVFAN